jgi:hypothetical protein
MPIRVKTLRMALIGSGRVAELTHAIMPGMGRMPAGQSCTKLCAARHKC